MTVLVTVIALFHLAYLVLVFLFIQYWKKIPEVYPKGSVQKQTAITLSVVIAVRNEEHNICFLLDDLQAQRHKAFEVIVVDDNSEDKTAALARQFIAKAHFPLQVLSLKHGEALSGKKSALQRGIDHATGDVIVTTDGDCRVKPTWLQTIHAAFSQGERDTQLITGPVRLEAQGNGILDNLQVLEFMSLIASGAASLQAGFPNMCNGANLAYTKQAFHAVGGFTENLFIPSGDDEFLMHKVYREFPEKVFFSKNKEGLVRTATQKTLKQFIAQRKRWGSKWKHYQSTSPRLLALFIFFYHLTQLTAFALMAIGLLPFSTWLGLLFSKGIAEYFFLSPVLKYYEMKGHIKWIAPAVFLYSFYVVTVGLLTNLGKYQWKGRTL